MAMKNPKPVLRNGPEKNTLTAKQRLIAAEIVSGMELYQAYYAHYGQAIESKGAQEKSWKRAANRLAEKTLFINEIQRLRELKAVRSKNPAQAAVDAPKAAKIVAAPKKTLRNLPPELSDSDRIQLLIAELDDAYAIARINNNPAAMSSASMAKAKLLGLVTDKSQVEVKTINTMHSDELARILEEQAPLAKILLSDRPEDLAAMRAITELLQFPQQSQVVLDAEYTEAPQPEPMAEPEREHVEEQAAPERHEQQQPDDAEQLPKPLSQPVIAIKETSEVAHDFFD